MLGPFLVKAARLPDNGIEIDLADSLLLSQSSRQPALARAGVANNQNSLHL
jgi:hypothetical protein